MEPLARFRTVLSLFLVASIWPACRGTGHAAGAGEPGAVYRAVGQEPGWVVEVGAGERPPMRVVLDYGERRLEVPRSQSLDTASGFRGQAGGLMVELRIMHEACRDTMSGEHFETRAELWVNGALYRGCGRFLTP
jgi:uncharacterized membrane protein